MLSRSLLSLWARHTRQTPRDGLPFQTPSRAERRRHWPPVALHRNCRCLCDSVSFVYARRASGPLLFRGNRTAAWTAPLQSLLRSCNTASDRTFLPATRPSALRSDRASMAQLEAARRAEAYRWLWHDSARAAPTLLRYAPRRKRPDLFPRSSRRSSSPPLDRHC